MGGILLHKRKKCGFTQQEMADKVGIERTSYNRIERGKRKPSVDIAIKIANVLNVKVDDIFFAN